MDNSQATRRARRDYTFLASGYDLLWRRYLARSIAATIEGLALSEHRRALDVGCGTGLLLQRLARAAPGLALVGLDATPAMLDRARSRLADAATLVPGDADRLPFADEEFDLVLSSSALHEVSAPPVAMHEMARVLAGGGTLAITDWRAEHWGTRARVGTLRLLARRELHPLTAGELVGLVAGAGLQPRRARTFQSRGWGLTTVHATRPAA